MKKQQDPNNLDPKRPPSEARRAPCAPMAPNPTAPSRPKVKSARPKTPLPMESSPDPSLSTAIHKGQHSSTTSLGPISMDPPLERTPQVERLRG